MQRVNETIENDEIGERAHMFLHGEDKKVQLQIYLFLAPYWQLLIRIIS